MKRLTCILLAIIVILTGVSSFLVIKLFDTKKAEIEFLRSTSDSATQLFSEYLSNHDDLIYSNAVCEVYSAYKFVLYSTEKEGKQVDYSTELTRLLVYLENEHSPDDSVIENTISAMKLIGENKYDFRIFE